MKNKSISHVTAAIQTYLFALTVAESKSMQRAAIGKPQTNKKKSFVPLSK